VAEGHALVDHGPPVSREAASGKRRGRGGAAAAALKSSVATMVADPALPGLDLGDPLGRRGVTDLAALTVRTRPAGVFHVLADGGAASKDREKRKKSHLFFLSE
jgi:hypothetical protein